MKAQEFNDDTKNKAGKMKASTKVVIASVVLVFIAAAVIITFMLFNSSKPAKFTLENDILKISGEYGLDINMSEVTDMSISNTIPKIVSKIKGSTSGSMYKGEYNMREIKGKSALLFLDAGKYPFIFLEYQDKTVVINCEEGTKTQDLYVKLIREFKKFKKD
ncbi:MAG: hypothetical protein Q8880_12120 [Bacteroidota bacterium]|nr:hypothetical protein [Bacteroidota bacterium]